MWVNVYQQIAVFTRVLARISNMPVQNSNSKISARPDLAINLLQILIPTTFGYYNKKVKIENSL